MAAQDPRLSGNLPHTWLPAAIGPLSTQPPTPAVSAAAANWPIGLLPRSTGRTTRNPLLVLAGGLKADNVAEAIRATGAAAVDTASGVESQPGIKDPVAVAAFVRAARAEFSSGQHGGSQGFTIR